jgi:hypothetical protein
MVQQALGKRRKGRPPSAQTEDVPCPSDLSGPSQKMMMLSAMGSA